MPKFFSGVATGRNWAVYIHETFPAFENTSVEKETLLRIYLAYTSYELSTLQLERLQVSLSSQGMRIIPDREFPGALFSRAKCLLLFPWKDYSSYSSSEGHISPSPKAGEVTGL